MKQTDPHNLEATRLNTMNNDNYERAKELGLTQINRWEEGIDHHPMSEAIVRFLELHDLYDYEDYFCWKVGGDGDNGEALAYQLDAFFELLDHESADK